MWIIHVRWRSLPGPHMTLRTKHTLPFRVSQYRRRSETVKGVSRHGRATAWCGVGDLFPKGSGGNYLRFYGPCDLSLNYSSLPSQCKSGRRPHRKEWVGLHSHQTLFMGTKLNFTKFSPGTSTPLLIFFNPQPKVLTTNITLWTELRITGAGKV